MIFNDKLSHLEELEIITCRSLETFEGLKHLPRLRKIHIYDTKIDFSEFMSQKMPPSLQTLSFHTGKSKIDSEIEEKIQALGYQLK